MSARLDTQVTLNLSPEQIAAAFWELKSDEQVEFFAALDRVAGIRLCQQMAFVVAEMAESGNREAQNGFRTMLAHAQEYFETATDWRAFQAEREIARLAKAMGGAA